MIKSFIRKILFNKVFKRIWNAISIRLVYRFKNKLQLDYHKIYIALKKVKYLVSLQNYQELTQTKELFVSIFSKLIEKEDLWLHSYKEILFSSLVKEYTTLGKSPYELHSDLIYISNPSN
jgi:hypothetical protein